MFFAFCWSDLTPSNTFSPKRKPKPVKTFKRFIYPSPRPNKTTISDMERQVIGPSGVHALPLAAGINEGGHFFLSIFLFLFLGFLLPLLFKTTEGVVLGFKIFAWAPKKIIKILVRKNVDPPPWPCGWFVHDYDRAEIVNLAKYRVIKSKWYTGWSEVNDINRMVSSQPGWIGLSKVGAGDCRHVCRKISASVDGGPSGGSRVRRPGSEDPHRR